MWSNCDQVHVEENLVKFLSGSPIGAKPIFMEEDMLEENTIRYLSRNYTEAHLLAPDIKEINFMLMGFL